MNKLNQYSENLFKDARSHFNWKNKKISNDILIKLYNLLKLAPTSANCSPARFIFVKSSAAKEKLIPAISKGNIDQTISAPITVIIAYDLEFYEHLDFLFPDSGAKKWFTGSNQHILETAFRNSTLQGAYLIMAARYLGLDCGPMSGFDEKKINEEFFKNKNYKVNFLCNLGYGNKQVLKKRLPRFDFDKICEVL
jgi:3-hydroxypropanoate dehydrogenase